MARQTEFEFPKGKIKLNAEGTAYIEYDKNYVNRFNTNANKVQVFLDKTVATNLQQYVSYRTGTQEHSIVLATNYGSGYVTIGVPYAEVQAYSKRIKKRVGKRGTRPFERMKADKRDAILGQVVAYSRRINNG